MVENTSVAYLDITTTIWTFNSKKRKVEISDS